MADQPPSSNTDSFMLGEIRATLHGVANDVSAMRVEIGDLARRVTATEKDVVSMRADFSAHKSERVLLLNDYRGHTAKVDEHMTKTNTLINQTTGSLRSLKWVAGVLGTVLLTAMVIIANQVWTDHRTVNSMGTRQVERQENQTDRRQERDDRYADRAQERASDKLR